jgi:hypothetical protein
VLAAAPSLEGAARVIAIDGRSGAGKTTLAERLAATTARSAVVHTDDIAWFHARFDWVELMREGVLEPVHRGEAVAYRPPPWDARARPGAVEVPAPCELLVVEGVGAARAELADLVDLALWVQSDREVARERGIERDGGDVAGWDEWQSEEVPFVERDRPWERAGVIVAGTGLGPAATLLVSAPRTSTAGGSGWVRGAAAGERGHFFPFHGAH